MLQHHGLNVAGVDIKSASDDHVFFTVTQHDKAISIHLAYVATADKAFAVGAEPFGLAGFVGEAVVARHHPCRSTHNFARLSAWQLIARFVDEADVRACAGTAYGVQFFRVGVAMQLAAHAAFGHAVVFDELAGPAAQHLGFELWLEGGAGAKLVLQTAQVSLLKVWAVHEALVLHGYQHGVRCTMSLG